MSGNPFDSHKRGRFEQILLAVAVAGVLLGLILMLESVGVLI